MKRLAFVGIMGLLTMGVFAQSWTVDGTIHLLNNSWAVARTTDQTSFSLSLVVGRYITDNLNVGLRGGFGLDMATDRENGYSLTVGPRVKYDFLHFERIYFSVLGDLHYSKFYNSLTYNNVLQEDANRFFAGVSPCINFQVNEMIEVYWLFAEVYYRVYWFNDRGLPTTIRSFELGGPFTAPAFGLTFKF